MSKFIKAINLWEDGIQQSICSGTLKIQRGQYVHCGQLSELGLYPLSRYVSHDEKSGTINVAHGGTGKQVLHRFKLGVSAARLTALYNTDRSAYFLLRKGA